MAFEIYKDDLAPSITDTIRIGGVAQDLTGATVLFRMRAENDDDVLVDRAAIIVVPETSGVVRFDWQVPETDVAVGDYLGWWRVTLDGAQPMDTGEFAIRVLEHASRTDALCTLADVREAMEYAESEHERDELILTRMESVSALIIAHTCREFAPATDDVARRFHLWRADYNRRLNCYFIRFAQFGPCDCRSVESVVLDPDGIGHELESSEWKLWPQPNGRDGVYQGLMIRRDVTFDSTDDEVYWGYFPVEITGNWGFAKVPAVIRDIAIDVIGYWLRRDIAQMGYTEANAAGGAFVPRPGGLDLPLFAKRRLMRWRLTMGA